MCSCEVYIIALKIIQNYELELYGCMPSLYSGVCIGTLYRS